jgi:hypothetical protein
MKTSHSLPVHLLTVILLTLLAGCDGAAGAVPTLPGTGGTFTPVAPGGSLPFEPVAQGYLLNATQPDPTVRLAAAAEDLDALAGLVTRDHLAVLKDIDFAEKVVLAVFWGVQPSGGCSITVEKLQMDDNGLTISVLLNENDANFPRVDASTYPYHLVAIAHDLLALKMPLRYRLVSADALLAEGELP